jgi:hypothetical protein
MSDNFLRLKCGIKEKVHPKVSVLAPGHRKACSHKKALRMIVDTPWYVPNTFIRRNLQIPSVKEEISHYSSLTAHPNDILLTLLEQPEGKRLRCHLPNDLPTRLMV